MFLNPAALAPTLRCEAKHRGSAITCTLMCASVYVYSVRAIDPGHLYIVVHRSFKPNERGGWTLGGNETRS